MGAIDQLLGLYLKLANQMEQLEKRIEHIEQDYAIHLEQDTHSSAQPGLLPCPFCGGEAASRESGLYTFYWCADETCCASSIYTTRAEWNRRANS